MKRIIQIIIALLIPGLIVAAGISQVFAVDVTQGVCNNPNKTSTPGVCGASPSTNPITGSGSILGLVITILAVIVGIVSVISLVISGTRMIAANGDTNSIASARKGVLYAIIGIVIAVLSRIIVSVAINHVG
jgi:hypothetical protein